MNLFDLFAWLGWAAILACIVIGMVRHHLDTTWERRDAKRRRR